MPQFDVMIGSGGVEQYFADTKAGAYKQAVKRHCKEGDVAFMKMTEAVITKEVLPKVKSFDIPRGEEPRVAKTIAFFYIANEDPDIWDVSIKDFAEEGYMDDFESIDAFLDKFFVKNKTKKIKEFKKNLFTMMRSAVFYLRFLNDPQVLFCNMDDIGEAVIDFVNGETNGGEPVGGDIWVNEDLGSLKLLKEKNGKLLPILTYDRKKIASDEEYREKFLNIFQTMAYPIFTKTEESKERFLPYYEANRDEEAETTDEETEDETFKRTAQKERRQGKALDKEEKEYLDYVDAKPVLFMGTEEPDDDLNYVDTITFEFKGKDYELDEETGAVYRKDEDGEFELVGFRRIVENDPYRNAYGGKGNRRETIIVRPSQAREEQERGLVHPFLTQKALDLRRELTDKEKIKKLKKRINRLTADKDLYYGEMMEEKADRDEADTRVRELEDKLENAEKRKKELEEELREAITATPVEVPTEPTSEFADVSKLLKEIADLTEAREKEKGEIVKVKSLESQVIKLERMLDNAIDEREEFATTVFELEEKLKEQKEKKREEDDDDDEEETSEDYDIISGILNSLGVDVDELLEAVKEEDNLFDFFDEPGYKNLVLKPIAEELKFKDIQLTDDEDTEDDD